MTFTTKFIDANIFIERWSNQEARHLIDNLDSESHCTSVLVLAEVYHKLQKRGVKSSFEYIRTIMGTIKVHELTQNDLFNAMKNPLDIGINDKIHIEVMRRNNITAIISFDKDFDKNKTLTREEP
ncbi:MAG: type II toxin-antitoxin system VapC family toxin [archaeon]